MSGPAAAALRPALEGASSRVLFVDTLHRFWTRMDQNYRRKFEYLRGSTDPEAFSFVDAAESPTAGIDATRYGTLLVGVFAALPSISDPAGTCVPAAWRHSIARRCVMVEDMWDSPNRKIAPALEGFDYLIATYECAGLEELLRRCPGFRRHWVIPHHIDTAILRNFRRERQTDVLIFGNLDPRTYAFRDSLARVLSGSDLRVKIVPCPDVDRVDYEKCGEGLANMLNDSWLCIATPSKHDYLLAKYFEAAACGAVVAGKMATQGETIWKGRYVALDDTMNDREILDIIRTSLKDKERLMRHGCEMADLIAREYSLSQYVSKLLGVLQEIAADHENRYPSTQATHFS